MSVQSVFDLAYVASKDPRIQALFAGSLGLPNSELDPGVRQAAALDLALDGLTIDGLIDAAGADPYYTMLLRQQNGYTTYPSILQPGVVIPPGINVPGQVGYNPALYAIKVSTNLADYPPFNPPAPVTPAQPNASLFGVFIAPGMYFASQVAINLAVAGAIKQGQQEVNPADGATYTFIISFGPMGNSYYWKAD